MLDPNYFDQDPAVFEKAISKRNLDISVFSGIFGLAKKRKELIHQVETLKAQRNQASQKVAQLKAQAKTNAEAAREADQIVLEMRQAGDRVKALDEELKQVQVQLEAELLGIPNTPHESVPQGASAEENQEVRRWGTPRPFDFEVQDHTAIGERLGILDFETATKLSGARFSLYQGPGATLERALIQLMLDLHTREHGYQEVIPPFLVNAETMTGTGQLPKFENDLFKTAVADRTLYLIPTSEVPLTNIFRQTILEPGRLPFYMTAYSPCFRSEAGSYGKDTRGLIRLHQFQKVELVKITDAETSFDELEKMVKNAERVLELLELPYRTMLLCGGDMGFGATKTYDLEVWVPSQNTYREISSCSNCGDFQARRAQIRYRSEAQGKPKLAHTLNGSGLAVGRTFVAILENNQEKDGSVRIPQVLNRYLQGAPGFEQEGGTLWMRPSSTGAKK